MPNFDSKYRSDALTQKAVLILAIHSDKL